LRRGIPNKEECLLLLRRLGLNEKTVQHSIAVSKTSLEIAERIRKNGVSVDLNLVEAGALLHDIGRHKVHGIEHGQVGEETLLSLGYPDSLARIAKKHVLCGMLPSAKDEDRQTGKNNDPEMTLEEKIVCYADKITLENKRTTLDERFGKWFRKYGKSAALSRALQHSKDIESELNIFISRKEMGMLK